MSGHSAGYNRTTRTAPARRAIAVASCQHCIGPVEAKPSRAKPNAIATAVAALIVKAANGVAVATR
jgi:hypothetical protein